MFSETCDHLFIYDGGILCFIAREWKRGAVVTAGGCCGQVLLRFGAVMFRIFHMRTKLKITVQLKERFKIYFFHTVT